jgi:ABC-type nickel/cobalt efflux system permease component RcnA
MYRYSELTIKQILLWFQVFSNILVVVSVNANLFRVVDETRNARTSTRWKVFLQHQKNTNHKQQKTYRRNCYQFTTIDINADLNPPPHIFRHEQVSQAHQPALPRLLTQVHLFGIDNRLSGQGVAIKKPSSRNSAS